MYESTCNLTHTYVFLGQEWKASIVAPYCLNAKDGEEGNEVITKKILHPTHKENDG